MLLERNNNTIHQHKLCLQNYRRVPVSIGLVVLNPEKEKGRHEIKPTIKLSFKGCGQHITQTGHPSPNTIIIRFRSDSSRAHARAEPTTCRTASIRKLCRDKYTNTHTHTSERRNVYDKNCPAKGAEGESITGLNRTHMLALDGSADGGHGHAGAMVHYIRCGESRHPRPMVHRKQTE